MHFLELMKQPPTNHTERILQVTIAWAKYLRLLHQKRLWQYTPVRSTPTSTKSAPTDAADVMIPAISGPIKQELNTKGFMDGYKIMAKGYSGDWQPSVSLRGRWGIHTAH